MNTPMAKNERVLSAVLLSALLHVVAAAALFLSLSREMPVSPWRQGLHLVWVSLEKNAGGKPQPCVSARASDAPTRRRMEKQPPADARNIPENNVRNSQQFAVHEGTGGEAPVKENPSPVIGQTGFSGLNGRDGGEDGASGKTDMLAYPLYKENSPPAYPTIARLRGYEGEVVLCVEILPNGRVGDAKIKKSSGYAILDQSALEAVKPWKFEPAKKSGAPMKVWVDLPIKFILKNQNSKS